MDTLFNEPRPGSGSPHCPLEKDTVGLHSVTLVRGATRVFEEFSIGLSERRIGVIGDNGAGKTSLFRLLCGLDMPSSGHVRVHGRSVTRPGQGSIGMMFQNPDEQIIFPTVDEELALSLEASGLTRRQAKVQARQWLVTRRLGHWTERAISSLSQGQRQHVCWLSLMIASPEVLLLDEPFASLDLPSQALLHQEIADAPQQILVSTHVLDHVRGFERVLWLDHGKVRGDGPGSEVCAAYEGDVACRAATRRLAFDDFDDAPASPQGLARTCGVVSC